MKPSALQGKIHMRDSNTLSKVFIPKSVHACEYIFT